MALHMPMLPSLKTLRILLAAAIFAGLSAAAQSSDLRQPAAETIDPMIPAMSDSLMPELHILFIGNSYTYSNDMPQMLLRIAQSDPVNLMRFTIQSVTHGGARLEDLWKEEAVRTRLRERRWDFVVLQEHSLWATSAESAYATTHAAGTFDLEIKQASAQTLLFNTWARKAGVGWYWDRNLGNREYMQKKLDMYTQYLASWLQATVIPVGDYWTAAMERRPDIVLYVGDGSHPSAAGSYLTALIFYRYFSQHNPDQVTYAPDGVPPEHAAFLRSIASW